MIYILKKSSLDIVTCTDLGERPVYFDSSDSTVCEKCPLHTYNDNPDVHRCIPCPEGYGTESTGNYGLQSCVLNSGKLQKHL